MPCCCRKSAVILAVCHGTSVFLLESEVATLLEVRHNNWPQHSVNVALRSDAISAPRSNVLKDNRPYKLVKGNASPDHDAGASPDTDVQDVVCSVPLVASPPRPDSAISAMDTEAALIGEEDFPPMPPVQVPVQLSPLQSLLSMSGCQNRPPGRTAAVQAAFGEPAPHSFPGDGCTVPANGVHCSF